MGSRIRDIEGSVQIDLRNANLNQKTPINVIIVTTNASKQFYLHNLFL